MSLKGIDVSNWQSGINVAAVPCDFVIIKATQGVKYVNPDCDRVYQVAKRAGKLLGVYHYFSGNDPVKEADFFVSQTKGYIGEAILVLDWEAGDNKLFSKGQEVAIKFLDRVRELTGVKPLIYMSKSVCRSMDWSKVVAGDYGLWMAQYANNEPTGYQEKPWTDNKGTGAFKFVAIHQYTSTGRLKGWSGNLDLNIAYMSAEAWKKYAASSKPKQHTVVKGDTLAGVAKKYGLTLEQLINLNPSLCKVGDTLRVKP
jgi:GH25 family lysozyme M1 (1,4-beta-N-acetylmuramidase)